MTPARVLSSIGCIVACVLAIRAAVGAHRARRAGVPGVRGLEVAIWIFIAITMPILAANRAFDLQSRLTNVIRERAFAEGWYRDRREQQAIVLVVVAALMIIALIVVLIFLRSSMRRVAVALIGTLALIGDAFVRVVSFHYIDKITTVEFRRVERTLEFVVIVIICIQAAISARRYRSAAATLPAPAEPERVTESV